LHGSEDSLSRADKDPIHPVRLPAFATVGKRTVALVLQGWQWLLLSLYGVSHTGGSIDGASGHFMPPLQLGTVYMSLTSSLSMPLQTPFLLLNPPIILPPRQRDPFQACRFNFNRSENKNRDSGETWRLREISPRQK
jgi:hypothetical protein